MSTRIVIAAFDSAAQSFGTPMFVPAIGVALRSFTDEINRDAPDNALFAHPEDYNLHLLAEFDEATGRFYEPEGGARLLVRGKDARREG